MHSTGPLVDMVSTLNSSTRDLLSKSCRTDLLSHCDYHNLNNAYPYLDSLSCGRTEPVSVGAEDQGIDYLPTTKCIEMFPLIQIPQHSTAILTHIEGGGGSHPLHLTITLMSTFPPEAHREPSGETVTQFRKPLCPKWLVFSLQLVRFQT